MNDWENPKALHKNREPARAYTIPFDDEISALQGDITQSGRYMPLNGDWAFSYFERVSDAPESLFLKDCDLSCRDTLL